jgi:hypothetical protein
MPHTNKDQGKHFGHHKAGSGKPVANIVHPVRPGPGPDAPPAGGSAGGDGGPPGSGPPPQRSGSKPGSPGAGQGGGCGNCIPQPPMPPSPGFNAKLVQQQPALWGQATPEIPDGACFYAENADFYNATTGGAILQSKIPIMVCGNAAVGLRQRAQNSFGYTHVALVDAMLTIYDDYKNQAAAEASPAQDFLAIPAGQANNFYHIVFCGVFVVPGFGKRKVLFLDRSGTPGDWPSII